MSTAKWQNIAGSKNFFKFEVIPKNMYELLHDLRALRSMSNSTLQKLLSISILNLHLKNILLLITAINTCAYAPKIKHKLYYLV